MSDVAGRLGAVLDGVGYARVLAIEAGDEEMRLRKAGAGEPLIQAVAKMSAERMKSLRGVPPIGSPAEAAARAAAIAEKEIALPPPLDEAAFSRYTSRSASRGLPRRRGTEVVVTGAPRKRVVG